MFKRGGSRPRKGRVTASLTDQEVKVIVVAIVTAFHFGWAFNRFITIHWERAGISEIDAAEATARFLKYARDYLQRKGLTFAYVWVRENDEGDGSKGHHVHILAHVPAGQTLGHLQRGWIKKITGQKYRAKVIDTRTIANNANAASEWPALYRLNLLILSDYVLKGASLDAAKACDLSSWGRGGKVIGKRYGMSKNLNRQTDFRVAGAAF